jgi:hypothetical protein
MKPAFSTFIVFLIMLVVACAPLQTTQPAATSQASGVVVEVSPATAMPPVTISATAENEAGSPSVSALPVDGVTLSENGMTFVMRPGESFLLNLGMDMYDWTVEVDNQDVIRREMNVMVIRGAQGIYIAQNPGTAILIASGNPLCLQSNPPCMMPSLLFRITVKVQ